MPVKPIHQVTTSSSLHASEAAGVLVELVAPRAGLPAGCTFNTASSAAAISPGAKVAVTGFIGGVNYDKKHVRFENCTPVP